MKFQEPAAQRQWRRYRLRAKLMLGVLPRSERQEIMTDLEAHVADYLDRSTAPTEADRLCEALSRLGEPRDYLGPLVEPTLEWERGDARLPGRGVARFLPARRLIGEMLKLAVNASAVVMGLSVLTLCVGAILLPTRFGIFRFGTDEYSVSILGHAEAAGTNALAWPAYLMMAAAALPLIAVALRALRRRIASAYFRLTEK